MIIIIVALVLFMVKLGIFHNMKTSKFEDNYKSKVIFFSVFYFIAMSIILGMTLVYFNTSLYHGCDHSENVFLIYLCVVGIGAVFDIFKDAKYEDL